jgi:hypothetical protein
MDPQQCLLDHVLGLGDTTEHPVGDRERDRPQLVEQALALGHAASPPGSVDSPRVVGYRA